jgi:transposase
MPDRSRKQEKRIRCQQRLPGTFNFERCFCRLTDWRRIATRYDKLAQNFFSALCFVATFAYWI